MRLIHLLAAFFLFTLCMPQPFAKGVYQTKSDFVSTAFAGESPKPKVLWINGEIKPSIEAILAHKFNKLRLKYWQQADESVWIMNEIGKESPITVGIHVKQGKIAKTKVLEYRETRGGEVRHDFFTNQFIDAQLQADHQLDKHIDGITGATLSVRALTKLSRIALYLDGYIRQQNAN
ncbi:FMN-binding protein [Shewanella gelidii]|uniref:FMN-binding domain-containing protein n=1 Tax=Shewanella gelidii TaxID=1642821 RepID=A0A917N6I3_9GAMM|nr:FMN-binding protein [Shewanella gelidii]MCL1096924.1 FMN-binding protein [Shewanella gelidii]GGI71243.1 hypothetical protein GCM10009332_05660 [Shewanella gelidii]